MSIDNFGISDTLLEKKDYSVLIRKYMNERNMTVADLTRITNIEPRIINCVCHNKNRAKTGPYKPFLNTISAIIIAFNLTDEQAYELMCAVYQEDILYYLIRKNQCNYKGTPEAYIRERNIFLYEHGYTPLGFSK